MRFPRIKAVAVSMMLALAFPVLAQDAAVTLNITAQSTPAEIAAAVEAALDSGASADAVVAAMVQAQVPPAAIATSLATAGQPAAQIASSMAAAQVPPAQIAAGLSAVGQTPAQVTATLIQAANVAPEAAVTAVTTAVPTATQAQLNQGLATAGVQVTAALQTQVAAAPAVAALPPAAAPVGTVTSAGLLVGTDGRAVVVQNEADQLRQVVAFVAAQVQNGAAPDTNTLSGLSQIIGNSVSAANNGSVNAGAVAAAVLQQLSTSNFTGGNAASVLQTALNQAVQVVQQQNPGAPIVIPPVSAT